MSQANKGYNPNLYILLDTQAVVYMITLMIILLYPKVKTVSVLEYFFFNLMEVIYY